MASRAASRFDLISDIELMHGDGSGYRALVLEDAAEFLPSKQNI